MSERVTETDTERKTDTLWYNKPWNSKPPHDELRINPIGKIKGDGGENERSRVWGLRCSRGG